MQDTTMITTVPGIREVRSWAAAGGWGREAEQRQFQCKVASAGLGQVRGPAGAGNTREGPWGDGSFQAA